ncbi:hypothetical protein VSX61_21395 [Brenneria populi subsp. brevivirga]|uniref:hypothetical protein n=1 Tax=Brenneria populi TaxID=1505588 RepID=UPI002E16EC00|nr:hypothetical protein [Brenneria populi subsp. brevivirga]
MAVNDKALSNLMLRCDNVREAKAYLNYCLWHQIKPESYFIKKYTRRDRTDPNVIIINIEDKNLLGGKFYQDIYSAILQQYEFVDDNMKYFIQKMIKEKRKIILNEENFIWLKRNERACYWLWLIVSNSFSTFEIPDDKLIQFIYLLRTAYRLLGKPHNLPANKLRYESIVDCFDSVCELKDKKEYMLNKLNDLWGDIYKIGGSFSWLEKNQNNEEKMKWMWSHMQKHEYLGNIVNKFTAPLERNELYFSIYACYDIWNASKSEKELFRRNSSNAWNQVHRRKIMGKKNRVAINAYVTSDTREKLNEISRVNKGTIGEVIDLLIYDKFKNEIKKS